MEEKMQVAYENEKFQWALKLAEALLDTKNKVSAAKVKFEKRFNHTQISIEKMINLRVQMKNWSATIKINLDAFFS